MNARDRIVVIVSIFGAIFMAFTIIDALSFMLTGVSVGENLFGGGSPIADAVLDIVPGMSPLEFLAVNAVALFVLCLVLVACLYYMIPPKNCDCGGDSK